MKLRIKILLIIFKLLIVLNYSMVDDNMKIILILLEKAEQILSIINLPDSAIAKYNTLKELSFDKIGFEYKPLTKKISMQNNNTNTHRQTYIQSTRTPSSNCSVVSDLSTINHNLSQSSPLIDKMKLLNIKKNMVIEFLFELIEKQKMESVHMYRSQLLKDIKQFQSLYDQIISFNHSVSSSSVVDREDYEFDAKIDELKLNDYISKLDISFKLFTSSLKQSSDYSIYSNNDFENIIQNYNKKIEDLKQFHRNEILQYDKKFESLKEKYNPCLAEELSKVNRKMEMIQSMLLPLYEKYSKKKISVYEPNKSCIDKEDALIQIVNFTVCFIEQLFKDNKHLIESIAIIEKDKQSMIDNLNLPFITHFIKRNELCKVIANSSSDQASTSEEVEIQLDNMISSLSSILNATNTNNNKLIVNKT